MNKYVPPSIGEGNVASIGHDFELKQEEQNPEYEESLWNEMHNEQGKHSKLLMMTRLIGSLSMILAFINIILFNASLIVIVASLCSLIVAPVIMRQRQLILQHCSTRYYVFRMKMDAERIVLHNEILTGTVTDLEQQVSRLQSIEQKLQATLTSQGSNLEQLQSCIKENRETLEAIGNIQMGEVMTSIFTAILLVDRNDDFQVSPIELKEALFRLRGLELNICTDTLQKLFLSKPKQDVFNLVKIVHELVQQPTSNKR